MSIALIVTKGFGNGVLVGTIKNVVTRGYDIADVTIALGYMVGETSVFSAHSGDTSVFSAVSGDTLVNQTG